MCKLASQLEFKVKKHADHFTLIRTADVTSPVREERLTLDQAAALLLETWKLRGHGS